MKISPDKSETPFSKFPKPKKAEYVLSCTQSISPDLQDNLSYKINHQNL